MAEKKTTAKKATTTAKTTATKKAKATVTAEEKSAEPTARKNKTAQEYNDQSIKALKGADRVRKRPGVIFGSDGLEGCEHSFFEILSNSVDEAREGHGNIIKVTAFRDHSIEVDDHGRGVPLGWNETEGRWNWDLVYCELYAGGKYENNQGGGAYEYSLGLNGLGACATQYSAAYMDVSSYNGTHVSTIHFKRGEPVSELEVRELGKNERRTGTVIRWLPDLEVFTDIAIPHEFYTDLLKRQAVVNGGIVFDLHLEQEDGTFTNTQYVYENGIQDYITELAGEHSLTAPVMWHLETQGRDREDKEEYKLKADFSFCATNVNPRLEYYHCASYLEHGGSPDRAVRVAFVYALDKYMKGAGKYNKTDSKITFNDIADSLLLVINSTSTLTSYENQTKKAITNTFIYEAMTEFLKQKLEIYFIENPMEAEKFANQVLINKRSRESAENARIDVKKKLTGTMDITNRVEKFVACRSKDPAIRELYIVEGDSALTVCKLSRNAEFQAIIPVRGKTLNCMKVGYDRIFKSDIITDLLRVIGCGVEINGKIKGNIPAFDLEALRWSKIILCTDADEDGFQIRTLLLTLFYRLLPTLLKEQRVFIAETPLFEITTKDETYFAYDEFEKIAILKKLGNKKYTLQRSKGLGENEPKMMAKTTMNPATRRLIAVTPADAAETERIFETLLGDDLPARKVFIAENGSKYRKDADI
ncbi:MAG: DNA topoisomerase [Clostridia bacterium]|nr:DNA topoisomerase [Clostridia bacterium]